MTFIPMGEQILTEYEKARMEKVIVKLGFTGDNEIDFEYEEFDSYTKRRLLNGSESIHKYNIEIVNIATFACYRGTSLTGFDDCIDVMKKYKYC